MFSNKNDGKPVDAYPVANLLRKTSSQLHSLINLILDERGMEVKEVMRLAERIQEENKNDK